MPITLTINGETAEQILSELQTLAGALTEPSYTYQLKPVAADPVFIDESQEATASQNFPPEDKPAKRKRRTKEEMEADVAKAEEFADAVAAADAVLERSKADDILSDDVAEEPTIATRADVTERMAKIIQQRLLTPKQLKDIFIEHAGGATNAAAMDDKFAGAVLFAFEEALAK